jgi:hypothetical protein
MQNLILNSMQPKIQETMSGRAGSGPGQSLASAASYRLQPSMAQARSPCPITENVFRADARPIKVGALLCLRERAAVYKANPQLAAAERRQNRPQGHPAFPAR